MTKDKAAAILTIFRAPEMDVDGKKAVADWLRRQAEFLEQYNDLLSETRYTARYLYPTEEE